MRVSSCLFWLALGTGGVQTSCGKKGCTDGNAINYDAKAKKDDGSCEFSSVVVYATDSLCLFYDYESCTYDIKVYLDGVYQSSITAPLIVPAQCGAPHAVTLQLEDGNYHNVGIDLLVIGTAADGTTVPYAFTGSTTLKAQPGGVCIPLKAI